MKRTQIYFTENENCFFKKKMKSTGLSMAEIVRRIVDMFIENQNNMPKIFTENENSQK
jgi:hypothetical protein